MQYAELPPERLDLVKRCLTSHDLHVRPVDILENEIPALWMVSNSRLAVLGVFNWDLRDDVVINQPLERLGLDPQKCYEAYEYWSDRYLGTIQGEFSVSLPETSCSVFALREAKPYPQLLSTSRHITQGLIDVSSEYWDPEKNEIQGCSSVAADDPYELRIVCPKGFTVASVSQDDQAAMVSSVQQADGIVRIIIMPSKTDEVNWIVKFRKVEK